MVIASLWTVNEVRRSREVKKGWNKISNYVERITELAREDTDTDSLVKLRN